MEKDTPGRFAELSAEPLNLIERIGAFYYILAAQLPLKDHRIPLSANRHFLALVLDVSRGKTASSLPELRHKLFPNYKTQATGLENTPEKGIFVIASNHYPEGPLKGSWQTMAIADVVLRQMPNGNRRLRFIIDSEKDSTGIFGDAVRSQFRKAQSNTLRNIAVALDCIPLNKTKAAIELFHQKNNENEIIGIFPTGKAEFVFKTPAPEAVGSFFEIAGNYNIPVLPIGAWHDKEEKIFFINIGKPIVYKKDHKNRNSKQVTAKKVMFSIASLVPPEMRGIYTPLKPKYK